MKHIGIITLLIGAAILIYRGIIGTAQSNVMVGVGLLLVVLGFVAHILINKRSSKAG